MKFLDNIGRIEAFSDAVFAFAATLLVVSLSDQGNYSVLDIDLVQFIGFTISFFVLVLLWKAHYNFFRRTSYIDNWIITFNSVLLFVVLNFVFPLKSLINSMFGKEQMTQVDVANLFKLYGLAIILIFLCFSLMYYRAYKKDGLKNVSLYFYTRHFAIFAIVAAISILLSLLNVGMNIGGPGFAYFLIGPICHFHAVWFYKKFKPS